MNPFEASFSDIIEILIYCSVLVAASIPLGRYMARVYQGERHWLSTPLGWLERVTYKVCGIQPSTETHWKDYAWALVVFNALGLIAVLGLQLFQSALPLNPQKLPDVPLLLSLNTAISFMTNTNWQAYSGESTLSYLTQMLGLNVQNFLSAATGMAVAIALVRAFTRRETDRIGNFWVDLTRSVVYILLPLSIVFSVILMSQGVVQSFSAYVDATTLEGAKQSLPLGPAASQIAIKQLGTNGGGFFGVNSAHPFENPTPLSNFLQVLAILLIPAALVHTFGRMVGNSRQGWSIFNAMLVLFVVGLAAALFFEYQPNPAQGGLPFLEGKELRFGIGNSALWATATTAASNGSVNAMHGSFSPIGGGVALVNMLLGEIVFGGVGAGLYGMLMYVLLAIFLAGLMVGRTPEYLGKKVEAREVILSATAVLVPSLIVLVFSAMALRTDLGLSSLTNRGPHGLSEVLYAFASAANNNGSAFGGLSANTNFYNALTGIAMLIGRFAVIIPVLAIAGGLAQKKKVAFGAGSFPTDTWLFTSLLVGVIVIVGALTFFPAVALGPIAEQLLLPSGKLF